MSAFDDIAAMAPQQVWDGIAGRVLHGQRITFAVVELDPGAHVPEHRHAQEQLGIVLKGAMSFRVGEETRDLRPGETWRIRSDEPHEAWAGPEGAVVIDVFSPTRDDWEAIEAQEPRPPRWP